MRYYVNNRAQANGDHEVHEGTCKYVPGAENRTYLGDFSNCRDAQILHPMQWFLLLFTPLPYAVRAIGRPKTIQDKVERGLANAPQCMRCYARTQSKGERVATILKSAAQMQRIGFLYKLD